MRPGSTSPAALPRVSLGPGFPSQSPCGRRNQS
nr:MAG TPA: hypothetical protein [Caudoviricetes sp.]